MGGEQLEIRLLYSLTADGQVDREAHLAVRNPGLDSPRSILFRLDAQFPEGRWWQASKPDLLAWAEDLLAIELDAFGALAPRIAGRLMREPVGDGPNPLADGVAIEWGGAVVGIRPAPKSAYLSARPYDAAELTSALRSKPAPVYEFVAEPWTLDLRHGVLASEPLPYEPTARRERHQRERTADIIEAGGLAHMRGFGWRMAV